MTLRAGNFLCPLLIKLIFERKQHNLIGTACGHCASLHGKEVHGLEARHVEDDTHAGEQLNVLRLFRKLLVNTKLQGIRKPNRIQRIHISMAG